MRKTWRDIRLQKVRPTVLALDKDRDIRKPYQERGTSPSKEGGYATLRDPWEPPRVRDTSREERPRNRPCEIDGTGPEGSESRGRELVVLRRPKVDRRDETWI